MITSLKCRQNNWVRASKVCFVGVVWSEVFVVILRLGLPPRASPPMVGGKSQSIEEGKPGSTEATAQWNGLIQRCLMKLIEWLVTGIMSNIWNCKCDWWLKSMLTYIIKWLAADPINNDLVELLDYAIWIASPPTTLYHFKRHQVDNHLTREKKTELFHAQGNNMCHVPAIQVAIGVRNLPLNLSSELNWQPHPWMRALKRMMGWSSPLRNTINFLKDRTSRSVINP